MGKSNKKRKPAYKRLTSLDKYRISGFIVHNPALSASKVASKLGVSVYSVMPQHRVVNIVDPVQKYPLLDEFYERLSGGLCSTPFIIGFDADTQRMVMGELEAGVAGSMIAAQHGLNQSSMRLFVALYEWAMRTVTNHGYEYRPQTRPQWLATEGRVCDCARAHGYDVLPSDIAEELNLPTEYVLSILDYTTDALARRIHTQLALTHGPIGKHETCLAPKDVTLIRMELRAASSLDPICGAPDEQFRVLCSRWDINKKRALAIWGSNKFPSAPDSMETTNEENITGEAAGEEETPPKLPPEIVMGSKSSDLSERSLSKIIDRFDALENLIKTTNSPASTQGSKLVEEIFALNIEEPPNVSRWLSKASIILLPKIISGVDFDMSLSGFRSALSQLESYELITIQRPDISNGKLSDVMSPRLHKAKSSECVTATPKGLSLWKLFKDICVLVNTAYCHELGRALGVKVRGQILDGDWEVC
jgi:hypothetical protein